MSSISLLETLIEPRLIDELEKVTDKLAATSFSAERMQDSLAKWRDLRPRYLRELYYPALCNTKNMFSFKYSQRDLLT